MRKKPKFSCGIKGCEGHASKMGCYQHRTTARKLGGLSKFGPITAIGRAQKKGQKKTKEVLPVALELMPIQRVIENEAFSKVLDAMVETLKGLGGNGISWKIEHPAAYGTLPFIRIEIEASR
jgi:hypothetical protein